MTRHDIPGQVDIFVSGCARSLGSQFRASRIVFAARPVGRRRSLPAGAPDLRFVDWPAWCRSYYHRHVFEFDPIRRWLDSSDGIASPVARLSDIMPIGTLRRSAALRTLLEGSGARHVLTIALDDDGRVAGALSLVRELGSDDFSDAEREQALAFAPLLSLALRGAAHGVTFSASRKAAAGTVRDEMADGESIDDETGDGAAPAGPLGCLTPREREVARLVCAGHPNKVVARMLDASPWTIKNHLRAVFEKTGTHNRTELCARLAIRRNMDDGLYHDPQ